MYEIWRTEGRSRVLVARFRMRADAVRYLDAMTDEDGLELVEPPITAVPPHSRPSSSIAPGSQRRSQPVRNSQPPQSSPRSFRRRRSGIVFASEHPDEFIADQVMTPDDEDSPDPDRIPVPKEAVGGGS